MNIFLHANEIINKRSEEKERQYGPINESMTKAANIASEMTNKNINTEDMYKCMMALKLSRMAYSNKYDTSLDLISYCGALNNYHNETIKKEIDNNRKYQIYQDVWKNGKEYTVRGLKTKEILNYSFTLKPYDRTFNFVGRKFNLKYAKLETLWYLKGDRFDTTITEHAKMWKTLINEDGSINSNYGQYINPNINRIINTLKEDKYSRRAVISIASNDNYNSKTNDYCCGQYISFLIRDNKLHINISFRSSDVIFGITNDVFTLSIYHELIYVLLRDSAYEDLEIGDFNFHTNSLHVYERHYKMINNILSTAYEEKIDIPKIKNSDEALSLLHGQINEDYEFSKWLKN